MLASQSKTFSLSQLPSAQAPLLLHPLGIPFIVDEHELQLIGYRILQNEEPAS
jgi:hypothetical protein